MQCLWLEFVQWYKNEKLAGVLFLLTCRQKFILDFLSNIQLVASGKSVYTYTEVFCHSFLNKYTGTGMYFEQRFFAYMKAEGYVSILSYIQIFSCGESVNKYTEVCAGFVLKLYSVTTITMKK